MSDGEDGESHRVSVDLSDISDAEDAEPNPTFAQRLFSPDQRADNNLDKDSVDEETHFGGHDGRHLGKTSAQKSSPSALTCSKDKNSLKTQELEHEVSVRPKIWSISEIISKS